MSSWFFRAQESRCLSRKARRAGRLAQKQSILGAECCAQKLWNHIENANGCFHPKLPKIKDFQFVFCTKYHRRVDFSFSNCYERNMNNHQNHLKTINLIEKCVLKIRTSSWFFRAQESRCSSGKPLRAVGSRRSRVYTTLFLRVMFCKIIFNTKLSGEGGGKS